MNKNDKRNEQGRSMVEMLGVLAIIGVLSVGGISAYGVAMKKHKANELMAATMQEAVLISAQLATGKTNPSLSSFNNSLFASASTVANSDNFKIALNAVDEDVCKQMKSMLGVSSMVHAISDNCGEMTFHKNLTPKAVTQSGGNSGNSGGNSGEGGSTEPVDPDCEGIECPEGTICGVSGNCIAEKTTDGTCAKNSDCNTWCEENGNGEKCYCSINATYSQNDPKCWTNFTGQCVVATLRNEIDEYLVSENYEITWWSAINFCKAHNASLISIENLGIVDGYQDGSCLETECLGNITWPIGQEYFFWLKDKSNCDATGNCNINNSCNAFVGGGSTVGISSVSLNGKIYYGGEPLAAIQSVAICK